VICLITHVDLCVLLGHSPFPRVACESIKYTILIGVAQKRRNLHSSSLSTHTNSLGSNANSLDLAETGPNSDHTEYVPNMSSKYSRSC
jgi:hypothetical protein